MMEARFEPLKDVLAVVVVIVYIFDLFVCNVLICMFLFSGRWWNLAG